MKKILLSLTFIAAMLTSCMRDSGLDYEGRGSVDVTVDVSAPELAATRATMTGMNSGLGAIDNFTDVEWANYDLRYIFEVYDVTPGFEDFDTPVKQRMIQTYDSYQETSFELRLIPNRQYKFVVWADIVEQGSEDDFRYDTSDLKCITRIGDVKPMDETMDAYFVQQNITIKDSAPQSLVLTRPFGKMRVISTDIDELNVGSVPYEVYVTFYNHPIFQSLNALTGNAENEVADVSYYYTVSKDAPYTLGYDYSPANQTIFADYIFAQSQVYGDQEVNFSIQVNEAGGREICYHTLDTQIPLGRNKLTTIIGNLFTTSTEFMISIDDDFTGEYIVDNIWNGEFAELPAPGADGWIEIDNPSQLATLLSGDCDGMNVRLVEDMNFDGLVIPSYSSTATGNNNSFVFDGNGHIISNFKTAGGVSAGLFSDLVKATVRNLTIQQALVAPDAATRAATRAAGDFYAGALVGRTYGNCVFENVHVINSVVNGVNKVGGLIGNVAENSVTISNCSVSCSTIETISSEDGGCVGGLVGYITGEATIENSAVYGSHIKVINSADAAKRANSEFVGVFHGGANKVLTLNNNIVDYNVFDQQPTSYVAPSKFYPWLGGVRNIDGADVLVDGSSLFNSDVEIEITSWDVTWDDTMEYEVNFYFGDNSFVRLDFRSDGLTAGTYSLVDDTIISTYSWLSIDGNTFSLASADAVISETEAGVFHIDASFTIEGDETTYVFAYDIETDVPVVDGDPMPTTIYLYCSNLDVSTVNIYYWSIGGESVAMPDYGYSMEFVGTDGWSGNNIFAYTFGEEHYGKTLNFLFNNGQWGVGNQTDDFEIVLDGNDFCHYEWFNSNSGYEPPVENTGYKIYAYSDAGWSNMNIWLWDDNLGTLTVNQNWPGDSMGTEVVNGVEYFVYTLPEGLQQVNLIFNYNGSPQTVDHTNVVFEGDRFFRVLEQTGTNGHLLIEDLDGPLPMPDSEYLDLDFVYATADINSAWNDLYINLYTNEGDQVRFNFWNCTQFNYLPENTYLISAADGCIYSDSYSWLNYKGVMHDLLDGYVTVTEVDGQYHISLDKIYFGNNMSELHGSFTGPIDGMVVPSAWTEETPETPELGGDGVVELTPYGWSKTWEDYGASAEFEICWVDENDYAIIVDFRRNPITPGTYTFDDNSLSQMYCKYNNIGMTDCRAEVTDAGDGQLAFDITFRAPVDGVDTDYHFTWVGDPSTLQ